MTPPEVAQGEWLQAGAPVAPPAVSVCPDPVAKRVFLPAYVRHGVLNVIAQRADFLKAASGRRQGTGSFLLQARDRKDGLDLVRIGFTASKKAGNAVVRARAKRRLRALAREILPELGRPGWDYVLVAKPGATVENDYARMLVDLRSAFASVHRERAPRDSGRLSEESGRSSESQASRGEGVSPQGNAP